MKASEVKKRYIEFFKKHNHKEIKNSSLIPENDPTVLFTTAGMHPLVPYLLGQKHLQGKRLVNIQKCIRTGDIQEVGDKDHLTFFEMLGNWSLGDYFKEEAIKLSYEFLTKVLKIPKEKLGISCFKGDKDAPKDIESAKVWLSLGIPKERIAFLGKKDNWWGPAGKTGPCGPDTEMFYWNSNKKVPKRFNVNDKTWVELGNDVFMEYEKDKRIILADGMNCIYNKDFKLNKGLLEIINSFNTHTLLTVNGFKEKGLNLIKNFDPDRNTNWQVFSLEERGIKKENPDYFRKLIKTFDLVPEEIIYFDHKKENIETAKKAGIKNSVQYQNPLQIKKFIEKNLWAFIPLKQKNVDFGGGVERTAMVLQNKETVFEIDTFYPIVQKIQELAKIKKPNEKQIKSIRIITDHLRSSVFMLGEEVQPSNLEQGYVLRRLIRTSIRHAKLLNIPNNFTVEIARTIIPIYKKDYPSLEKKKDFILTELKKEEEKFEKTLTSGLKQFEKLIKNKKISGKDAFILFSTYGFPLEMTENLAEEHKIKINKKEFEKEFKKHQDLSRTSTKGKFGSGLADSSRETTRLHTATHLLHAALRKVLGNHVQQKGSNITKERLRFDFSHDKKMTEKEIRKVEDLVNQQIKKKLPVIRNEMSPQEAKNSGALGFFEHKYGDRISVFTIKGFSKEICTGPHINNTSELGKFKIIKEQSVAAGIRRIKAVLN